MWIARDKNGSLWLSVNKPTKDSVQWVGGGMIFLVDPNAFPEIRWEDKEPRKVILKLINEE